MSRIPSSPAAGVLPSRLFRAPSRPAALLAVMAAYGLIVLGATVRASGSGLGCPDWPLCQGGALPPGDVAARIEYAHRVAAGATSALVLLAAVLTLRQRPAPLLAWAAGALPLVLGGQIALGALSVLLELPPVVLAAHLGLGFLLLGLLVFMATYSPLTGGGPAALAPGSPIREADSEPSTLRSPRPAIAGHLGRPVGALAEGEATRATLRRLCAGAVAAVYLLALTGAWVRTSGASWACGGFPLCNGEVWPIGGGRLVDIHLLHRFVALAVGAHLLVTLGRAARTAPPLRGWSAALAVCLALQGATGALGASSGWSPLYQVLHVAGAAGLWAVTVGLFSATLAGGRVKSEE